MYVQADVSLYPLAEQHLMHPVHDFVELLEKNGCEVETGPAGSSVKGESDRVFGALQKGYEQAALKSGCVLIVKSANACPL